MQYLSNSFKPWLICNPSSPVILFLMLLPFTNYMAKFLRNSYPADCSLPCAPVAETCSIVSIKRKSLLEPYSCGGLTTVEWNWHAMLESWKPQHTHAHKCIVCVRERERERESCGPPSASKQGVSLWDELGVLASI